MSPTVLRPISRTTQLGPACRPATKAWDISHMCLSDSACWCAPTTLIHTTAPVSASVPTLLLPSTTSTQPPRAASPRVLITTSRTTSSASACRLADAPTTTTLITPFEPAYNSATLQSSPTAITRQCHASRNVLLEPTEITLLQGKRYARSAASLAGSLIAPLGLVCRLVQRILLTTLIR